MPDRVDALVIGAGVVGLTAAIALRDAGLSVRVVAEKLPPETDSASSGAIWGPFLSTLDSRVLEWSFQTLDTLKGLSSVAATGVYMVDGVGATTFKSATPWWVEHFQASAECEREALPSPYILGWRYRVPIIDMPLYLDYLALRLRSSGASIEQCRISTLDEVRGSAHHVVVCPGLGARELCADPTLLPSKGQLVVMDNPGITTFFAERGDGPDLTYILPQRDKVVLGGTAESTFLGADMDPEVARQIVARCARIEPALMTSRVRGHRVGMRPCRATVRLEHEIRADGTHVIYNYGHGGSGVSLAWACADSVLSLIQRCPLKPSGADT